jgi:hypothetical protein
MQKNKAAALVISLVDSAKPFFPLRCYAPPRSVARRIEFANAALISALPRSFLFPMTLLPEK